MKKTILLLVSALMSITMTADEKELKLYTTNFQNWDAVSSATNVTTKKVTTRYSQEELTFSFTETEVKPDGTNSKFTSDVITTGYIMAAKSASPYFETSALKNVTKVHYVHASTGGKDRGWGLQYKTTTDADWITISDKPCEQAGTAVEVAINKENVQLRWYNLKSDQNAYMTEFTIFGMADDDGQPMEYNISYFDQNGTLLGTKVQTEKETLSFAYSEKDLTIPEGYKFRGWVDGDKKKHAEGEAITDDLRLSALVTKIETATPGTFWEYDLTSDTFYPEDHELIDVETDKVIYHLNEQKTIIVSVANGKETFAQDEGSKQVEAPKAGLQKVTLYFVKEFMAVDPSGYKIVPAGDAASLLLTLRTLEDNDKVFLPNGTYDLGETVLTQVNKKNISLIGQSMKGAIIKNAPDYRTESINNTATLYLTGEEIYLQDLTIQNALDYYKANNGRAVALWSKCSKVVCKNVRLLSYQDTYYSNKVGGVHYFEDCEIHGTVDFICGDGSVYFKNNLLFCEKRNTGGGGSDAITASNADKTDKGYVFESCRVQSECPTVSLGRMWNNAPQCVYLNTIFDESAGKFSLLDTRWTPELMSDGNNGDKPWPGKAGHIGEFNTLNTEGQVISPASNVVKFTRSGESRDYETILKSDEAAQYTMEYTLGAWAATAKEDAKQVDALPVEDAGLYLVENPDGQCFITTGEALNRADLIPGATFRRANARGGFGKKAGEEEGIDQVQMDKVQSTKIIRDGQLYILYKGTMYNVQGGRIDF